jgi:hypothetical protein
MCLHVHVPTCACAYMYMCLRYMCLVSLHHVNIFLVLTIISYVHAYMCSEDETFACCMARSRYNASVCDYVCIRI